MSVAINGSGTITGLSVGGIPDGVVDTDALADNAVIFGKIGTTEQGQLCKAWVNFNGTGTVAIRASYNVSSITDLGVGIYTVNFTTAFADASYSALASTNSTETSGYPNPFISTFTTGVSVTVGKNATTNDDASIVCVAVFR